MTVSFMHPGILDPILIQRQPAALQEARATTATIESQQEMRAYRTTQLRDD